MGYGGYDLEVHESLTRARASLPTAQVFGQAACHPDMLPTLLRVRESRDSAAHRDSVGIVFALDVSGSMGAIPHQMATQTLPMFMSAVTTVLPDPQVLFIAFGNAYADRSPLQVGQFESEAVLIDAWLSRIHLEGGGGGVGESYDLAMLVGARFTRMDCVEKRQKKGYFFMTADERCFGAVSPSQVWALLNAPLDAQLSTTAVANELLSRFHVFVLIPDPAHIDDAGCVAFWQHFLGDRVVLVDHPEDMAVVSAVLVGITEGRLTTEAHIEDLLETQLKRVGAERDRIVRTVLPYARAFVHGSFAPPGVLGAPTQFPAFKG